MTIDLAAIQARLDGITPPPWFMAPDLIGPEGAGIYNEDGGCICEVGDPYPRGNNNPQENMVFIAHAPEDIRALLAENERLRSQVTEFREGFRLIQKQIVGADWSDHALSGYIEMMLRTTEAEP